MSNQVNLWRKGPSKTIPRLEWSVWTSGNVLEWFDHKQRSAKYVDVGDNKNSDRTYPSEAAALAAMQRAIAKKLKEGWEHEGEPPPPPPAVPSKPWKKTPKAQAWLSKSDAKQLAAIRKAIEGAGLSHRRADIESLLRPAIRFALKTTKSVKGVTTRFGGDPDVPAKFAWPSVDGIPLAFVAQYRFDELSKLDLERKLPKRGLLSIFAQLVPEDGYGSNVRAFVFDPKSVVRLPSPHEDDDRPSKQATVTASVKLTLPSPDEAVVGALRLNGDERSSYHDNVWLVTCAMRDNPSLPGAHRLLGWPDGLIAGPKGWELLAQIDSDDRLGLELGDVETLRIEISTAKLARADFGKVSADIGGE